MKKELTRQQWEEVSRRFKDLNKLTKAELVSILKELQHRMFSIVVNLNNSAPVICDSWPDDFKKQYKDSHNKAVKSAYEAWYYLGAIGAYKGKWTKEKAEYCADSMDLLHDPLKTQKDFLRHTKK